MRYTPIPVVAAAAFLCCGGVARSADWLQFGYDPSHSGNNPDETTLTRDNVAQLNLWSMSVDTNANIDAAPVYLANASTVAGTVNLLFDVSQGGAIVAVNADTGSLIWSHGIDEELQCPWILIYSAPAIDPARNSVYAYGCDGFVHKYAVFDGAEATTGGWPEVVTLKPDDEHGSSALAISPDGRYLYSVMTSFGDGGDYQGHLTTIDLETGRQAVFNAMCSDMPMHFVEMGQPGVDDCAYQMSGIWGRPGVTSDPSTGRIYITTGNGLFDANFGGHEWGDSVLAFYANGTGATHGIPLDSYTPSEYDYLGTADLDLGSVSLAIIPPLPGSTIEHVGLQTGKDGVLRLIDLGNMNGSGVAGSPGGEISTLPIPSGAFYTNAQPAVWTDTEGDGSIWVFVEAYSGFSALKVELNAANRPVLRTVWFKTEFYGSGSPVVANGVLYALPGAPSSEGHIYALDPHDGSVLWQSPAVSAVHWETPIVVNGSIFVSGRGLQRYSLGMPPVIHTVFPVASEGGSIAPGVEQYTFDGGDATFTILPDSHHLIAGAEGCGGALDGATYTTGAIIADCTVTATFEPITHVVTPSAGANGSIEPSTPQTVDDGNTASFTLTPTPPYVIDGVIGCDGKLTGSVYTTAAISGDCTVVATFSPAASDTLFRNGFEDSKP